MATVMYATKKDQAEDAKPEPKKPVKKAVAKKNTPRQTTPKKTTPKKVVKTSTPRETTPKMTTPKKVVKKVVKEAVEEDVIAPFEISNVKEFYYDVSHLHDEDFDVEHQELDEETEALKYHALPQPGKYTINASKVMATPQDLTLAYSPGVAEPCVKIQQDPNMAYRYTTKGNMVAVITNGTAVLGLGNIGALASKPVMEGKSVLL